MSATISSAPGVSSKRGRAARARSTKSWTAGEARCVRRLRGRQRERLDRESHLARDMEHLAARREHPDVGAPGEHRRCNPRSLPDDRFAGIEEEDGGALPKAGDRARERVGAAGVDGGGDEAHDVVRAARSREVDAPRAGFGFERAGDLHRESALPDAWRPGQASRGGARAATPPPRRAPARGRRTTSREPAGCHDASPPRRRGRSPGPA